MPSGELDWICPVLAWPFSCFQICEQPLVADSTSSTFHSGTD
jgi:hypothetical protein